MEEIKNLSEDAKALVKQLNTVLEQLNKSKGVYARLEAKGLGDMFPRPPMFTKVAFHASYTEDL